MKLSSIIYTRLLAATVLLTMTTMSHAAMITNGDFQTCDFTGWNLDTDGLGDPGPTNDFAIEDIGGACRAQLNVDDGATTSVFFANTLSTLLDLSANPGESILLSFDWVFSGTDGDPDFGDFFSVFLDNGVDNPLDENGEAGFLIPATSGYGGGSFSVELGSNLNNLTGWSLNFVLEDAVNPLGFFNSTLAIDNVSLTAGASAVSEPQAAVLILLGFLGITLRRRNQKGA